MRINSHQSSSEVAISLSDLPEEVLLHILSFLPYCQALDNVSRSTKTMHQLVEKTVLGKLAHDAYELECNVISDFLASDYSIMFAGVNDALYQGIEDLCGIFAASLGVEPYTTTELATVSVGMALGFMAGGMAFKSHRPTINSISSAAGVLLGGSAALMAQQMRRNFLLFKQKTSEEVDAKRSFLLGQLCSR